MAINPDMPLNAFTVDLEDWFQGLTSTNPRIDQWPQFESRVVPATQRLLAILKQYEVRATFFVLGYVADHHPELIEAIRADGHEIAVHGYWHYYVSRLSAAEFSEEIARSLETITAISGERPVGHRAPYFSVNKKTPWVFDVLREHGFRYDSSIFPIRNGYYGFPGMPRFPYRDESGLMEFPPSTIRFGGNNWPMAGGFYLRMLPYRLVRWAIRRLNRQGQPAVLYMHPWELDLEQPIHAATARERITHYGGRHTLALKLHHLFDEFRFGPLCRNLENYETPQSSGVENTRLRQEVR